MKTRKWFGFIGILMLFAMNAIACATRRAEEQFTWKAETADIFYTLLAEQVESENEAKDIHVVRDQGLVFPPRVNLLHYLEVDSVAVQFNSRFARIWGWSTDGKIAFSIEGAINSEASYQIEFVVLDLIENKVLFSLIEYSRSATDWLEGEELFKLYAGSINDALQTHNIIGQRAYFSPLPTIGDNMPGDVEIIDIERGEDEYWQLGETILRYSVLATTNKGSQILGTFTPFLWLFEVHVCGYFLSPFENRVLVIIAEDLGQYSHGGIMYRYIGFHLEEDFG